MAEARLRDLSPERWRRINQVLDGALDRETGERGAWLDAACAGDEALRTEVEQLLAACERADGFLADPAPHLAGGADDARDGAGLPAGARVGRYRIVRELGRGGMGIVYLAERDDPQLRQQVALKMAREGLHAGHLVRRFLEERQIVASLEHPGVARLLDGAVTAEGVPWFAMEHVEGVPLDRYCDAQGLGIEARLELVVQVCDAVQYAHRNLVVHRDLKPSNILVTAAGRPKLLDFGIARLVQRGMEAAETRIGMRLLTPEYASPEQLRGDPVSTASDVSSLGVLLYQLLCGRLPHRPGGDAPFSVPGALLGPPPPPSSSVDGEDAAAHAAARGTTPARLARRLRGDLDAVVLKAMRPEPGERYASAEQLAADLRRYAAGLPVAARADTRRYRARKFVRRHRAAVAAASAALLLLVGFSAVTQVQARHIAAERDRARQVESFLLDLFERSDPYEGSVRAVTVRDLLDRGAADLAGGEVRQPQVRWRLFFALGKGYYGLGDYDRAIALMDSAHQVMRRYRGDGHGETMAIANQLANVLRVAGRYAEAEAHYRVILEARRGEDDEAGIARSLNGLAMGVRMQGRYREAEALLREALAIDRAHAAQEPRGLPQTLNNLGHVMREQGRLADAEALHRESLAARRAIWGPEHFEVAVSLGNLAGVLRDRGDFAAADTLYRQVLALRGRLAGESHPDLAMDRAGYALLLYWRGDLAGAEALYRQALPVQRRALAAGHPLTAATLTGLGTLLVDAGRPAEARPLLEEALAARRRVLPADDWQVAETQSALGACLAALGRSDEGAVLLRRASAVLDAALGPESIPARRARARLADPGS